MFAPVSALCLVVGSRARPRGNQLVLENSLTYFFIPALPVIEPFAKRWLGLFGCGFGPEIVHFQRTSRTRCDDLPSLSNESAAAHHESFLRPPWKYFPERPLDMADAVLD